MNDVIRRVHLISGSDQDRLLWTRWNEENPFLLLSDIEENERGNTRWNV